MIETSEEGGKRKGGDVAGTPETAKKTKAASGDVVPVQFDPTFGVGAKMPVGEEEASSSEKADSDDDEDITSNILDELIEMFRQQNGRDPTEAEIAQWTETFKSAKLMAEEEGERHQPQTPAASCFKPFNWPTGVDAPPPYLWHA